MKQRYFFTLISFFVLLLMIQLFSGITLFIVKFGLYPDLIRQYFLGDPEHYIMAKSFCGLIKTAFIHFFAYGVILFIVTHFVMMIQTISMRLKINLIIISSIAGFIDIVSNFLIKYEMTFVYSKLLAFITFELTLFLMLFLILKSLYTTRHP
jgi:hypothetical protein